MRQYRIAFLLLFALGAVFGTAPGAAAQDVERILEKADAQAAQGKWAGARQQLLDLLAAESARKDVLAHFNDIRQRLANWSFETQNPELGPDLVFVGEASRWKAKKRTLRLRYDWTKLSEAEKLRDFELLENGDWLFRVPVEGNLKFKIEGDWDPELEPISMLCSVGEEGDAGWRLTPGFHRTKVKPTIKMPRRVERFGEPRETLLRSVEDLEEPTGDWSYTIEIKRDQITLRAGSRRLGQWKTKHPDYLNGRLGFRADGIKKVEIESGLDEAAWDGHRQLIIEQLRNRYLLDGYELRADLPRWALDLMEAAETTASFRPPTDAPEAVRSNWLVAEIGARDRETVFDVEQWKQSHNLSGALAHYAEAIAKAEDGDWLAADAAAKAAAEAGLEFGPVHVLLARSAYQMGFQKQALARLEDALTTDPIDAGRALLDLKGRQFGPREKLKICDQVIAAGYLGADVLRLRDQLAEVTTGPAGKTSRRFTRTSALILSDGDEELVKEVGEWVTNFAERMPSHFPLFKAPKEPLAVVHFRSESTRLAFCRRVGLPEDSLGYMPDLRVVFIAGDLRSLKRPRKGVNQLHRGLALAFMDATLDLERAPRWFVEGNAQVYAASDMRSKTININPSKAMAEVLDEHKVLLYKDPKELALNSNPIWLKREDRCQAESWLLTHYLRLQDNSGGLRGVFSKYMNALANGLNREQAWTQAMEGQDAGSVNEGYHNWMSLQVSRAKAMD